MLLLLCAETGKPFFFVGDFRTLPGECGWGVQDVTPDGNCFFDCSGHGVLGSEYKGAMDLRQKVAIRAKTHFTAGLVNSGTGRDEERSGVEYEEWAQYQDHIAGKSLNDDKKGVWADDFTGACMSHLLECNIIRFYFRDQKVFAHAFTEVNTSRPFLFLWHTGILQYGFQNRDAFVHFKLLGRRCSNGHTSWIVPATSGKTLREAIVSCAQSIARDCVHFIDCEDFGQPMFIPKSAWEGNFFLHPRSVSL